MKKFGHAVSEDADGDGKKTTSSSGRQPAAQDQQDRDAHADTAGEGTGPQTQERTDDAAPLTHPAPPEDTSTGSMPMDGPQKTAERTARVAAIQERMAAIHTLHTDGDLPGASPLSGRPWRRSGRVISPRSRTPLTAPR